MARKTTKKKKATKTKGTSRSEKSAPKFPYSTLPGGLRKVLALIPDKPKPPKLSLDVIKSWGIKSNNASTILRVLRDIKLLNQSNEPTETYAQFMDPSSGSVALGGLIRARYPEFFEAHHEPHRESGDALRSLFNIHSGGEEGTIDYQIQTFKALCDHATFSDEPQSANTNEVTPPMFGAQASQGQQLNHSPVVHIDLHIHLPEGKTRRDYEAMFEDIARCIYGKEDA